MFDKLSNCVDWGKNMTSRNWGNMLHTTYTASDSAYQLV